MPSSPAASHLPNRFLLMTDDNPSTDNLSTDNLPTSKVSDTPPRKPAGLLLQQRHTLPPGARDIILVRHGSSTGGTGRRLDHGQLSLSDPELSDDGHTQAAAVARRLLHEPIAAVYASPMIRTRQTAAPFLAATGLGLTILDDLHEIHMGDWEHDFHLRAAEGHPLLERLATERNWEVIPNAETVAAVGQRLRRGMANMVRSLDPGQTAVAFLHGGVIAEICRLAMNIPPLLLPTVENTGVSRLIIDASGAWKLRSYNDVLHLTMGL